MIVASPSRLDLIANSGSTGCCPSCGVSGVRALPHPLWIKDHATAEKMGRTRRVAAPTLRPRPALAGANGRISEAAASMRSADLKSHPGLPTSTRLTLVSNAHFSQRRIMSRTASVVTRSRSDSSGIAQDRQELSASWGPAHSPVRLPGLRIGRKSGRVGLALDPFGRWGSVRRATATRGIGCALPTCG
jgi:hypothetical protein